MKKKSAKTGEVFDSLKGKRVKFGAHWRNRWIGFLTLEFAKNGSLTVSSKFHNKSDKITIGAAILKGKEFNNHIDGESHSVDKGCHISLHPPLNEMRGAMHFRKNYPGKILHRREIDWFPVKTEFNLISLYTPPLRFCESDQDKSKLYTPIPDDFASSIQVKVDIFPRDVKEHYPYLKSVWDFWGHCPDYRVRVSYLLTNQEVSARLYWPESERLEL